MKLDQRLRMVLEGAVDVAAIAGLVVLGCYHVVEGSVIVPVISVIAAGSIGARLGKRDDATGGTPGGGASILLMGLVPALGTIGRLLSSRSARVAAMVALALTLSACGSNMTASGAYRETIHVLKTVCEQVDRLPDSPPTFDVDAGAP